MEELELRRTFSDNSRQSRRVRRAARTRAKALSPMRILIQVLFVPLVTLSLTVSIYIRTSPYERDDALRHLAALAGCETALAMGVAPSIEGGLGYHARNDPDGDGIACEPARTVMAINEAPVPLAPAATPVARSTGAKFIKP